MGARAGNTPFYAASLNLRGVPVLVVGGGEVAARKIGVLLDAEADVTVVSPQFHRQIVQLRKKAGPNRLRMKRRSFRPTDVKGKKLVFAATHDEALNSRIARAAAKLGAFVNVASPGHASSFHVPATVRRGRLSIAISTGGVSAALAKTVRQSVERVVGPEWGTLADLLHARRERVLKSMPEPHARHRLLSALGGLRWARLIKKHGAKKAGAEMDKLIRKACSASRADIPVCQGQGRQTGMSAPPSSGATP